MTSKKFQNEQIKADNLIKKEFSEEPISLYFIF